MDEERGADWHPFFSQLTPTDYLSEVFTQNTVAEVDFLTDLGVIAPGKFILDLGCGPGRHAREIARRGAFVTGVDFTEAFLAHARAEATRERVADRTEFVLTDARDFIRPNTFDAAVCLCEGAFSLLSSDADNQTVLNNVARSLKPGAPFVLTTLNGYRAIRNAGTDPATQLDSTSLIQTETFPHAPEQQFRARYYVVPELIRMHEEAGLRVKSVWGGTAGNWGRRPLNWDEIEVMLISFRGEATSVPNS
jgi:cyclopropane fatty-acyl-phospholipid synthase-like methyltransferase